jgi:hypothetical protein
MSMNEEVYFHYIFWICFLKENGHKIKTCHAGAEAHDGRAMTLAARVLRREHKTERSSPRTGQGVLGVGSGTEKQDAGEKRTAAGSEAPARSEGLLVAPIRPKR